MIHSCSVCLRGTFPPSRQASGSSLTDTASNSVRHTTTRMCGVGGVEYHYHSWGHMAQYHYHWYRFYFAHAHSHSRYPLVCGDISGDSLFPSWLLFTLCDSHFFFLEHFPNHPQGLFSKKLSWILLFYLLGESWNSLFPLSILEQSETLDFPHRICW